MLRNLSSHDFLSLSIPSPRHSSVDIELLLLHCTVPPLEES